MILVLWQVFKFSFFFFIRKQIYCVKNIRSSFVCENCWNPLMVLSLLHGRIRSTFGKKVPDPTGSGPAQLSYLLQYSSYRCEFDRQQDIHSSAWFAFLSATRSALLLFVLAVSSLNTLHVLSLGSFFNESPVKKSLVLCPLQSELGTRNFSASQRQKGIVSVARLLGWLSQPVWPLSSTVLGREKGNNDNFYII